MQNKFVLIFTSIILILGLYSCDDAPTSLGTSLLPNQDLIDAFKDSSYAVESKFYGSDTLALSSASRVFLGVNGNIESTMLMKFYMFFPDSIKNAILGDSLVLKSAVMEMEPVYTFGKSTNDFDFSVHKITSTWNSLDFSKSDFEKLDYDADDVSSNHNIQDSLITFDIDTTLVNKWLVSSANSNQVEENHGIYFKYSSGTNKIIGFPAISSRYDSVLTRLVMVVKVGVTTDTLTIKVTSDAHVVNSIEAQMPVQTSETIFVQGGIPIRSDLKIDVSSIPKHAIINKATLKLFVDEDKSQIGTDSSKFIGALMLDDFESSEISTSFSGIILKYDSLAYSGEITQFVQEWVANTNNGMKLYLFDEVETVNKIAIYGAKADTKLRPYLEIIYTSKN